MISTPRSVIDLFFRFFSNVPDIWFAEKTNGESHYFSLADFDARTVPPKSPFSRWYLEGRFDAIPRIDYQKITEPLLSMKKADAKTQ